MKLLIVIVPVFNEADQIGATVGELVKLADVFEGMGIRYKVFVVDDGSTDGSGDRARQAGASRVLRHHVNQGLGAAVRSGLNAARAEGADLVVKFDGDFQHDPSDIPRLLQPIFDDAAEVVYGNRFQKIEYSMPLVRRLGNAVFTGLMRALTGWPLKDSQPGIFAVSRSYLEVFYLPGNYNYTQQILIDAFHKGMRFAHVPVSFRKRRSGRSFISLKYPFKVLPQIIQVIVGIKPLLIFTPIALFFLSLGTVVFFWNLADYFFGDGIKPVENVNLVLGCSFFGLQSLFFGFLADLIIKTNTRK